MRKLTKQEKKILNNYEAMFGIKEDTILSGGIAKRKKPTLDEYDNQGYEDNTYDLDWNLNYERSIND